MNLSDINLPKLELSSAQRETLDKYLPLVIVALLVWFAARGLRRCSGPRSACSGRSAACIRCGICCTDRRLSPASGAPRSGCAAHIRRLLR